MVNYRCVRTARGWSHRQEDRGSFSGPSDGDYDAFDRDAPGSQMTTFVSQAQPPTTGRQRTRPELEAAFRRKVHTAVEYSDEYGLTGTSVYVYGHSDLAKPCNPAYVP